MARAFHTWSSWLQLLPHPRCKVCRGFADSPSCEAVCWPQNPAQRPSFSVVAARLRAMRDDGLGKRWDLTEREQTAIRGPWCSCCGSSATK